MKKKKVYLEDIIAEHPELEYQKLYETICRQIEQGVMVPIKDSPKNGMKPALPLRFWKYEQETDYTEVLEELKYKVHPRLNMDYYRKHPERYEADQVWIQRLSDYLRTHTELLHIQESMNERSFEIFCREKFFQKEGGLEFCKRVGISSELLAFYETSEPLSYYSRSKEAPQNILIVENKDTFYDIRKYMEQGKQQILGRCFGTVIYGAGKGIWKTFADYENRAERYFCEKNRLFYFGDLDYEGILIYEQLNNRYHSEIELFTEAYERMLEKAERIGMDRLPDTKEKQNHRIGTMFLGAFSEAKKSKILSVLENGKYIPQEILNEHDWG